MMVSATDPVLVKPCYNRRLMQIGIFLCIAVIVLGLFFMGFAWFVRIPKPDLLSRALEAISRIRLLTQGFFLVLLAGSSCLRLRYSIRQNAKRDHLRQLAASGDRQTVHLAQKQPESYSNRLVFPITVRIFMPIKVTLWWLTSLLGLATLVLILLIAQTPDAFSNPSGAMTVVFVIFALLLLVWLVAILLGSTAPKKIIIADTSITVKELGGSRTIHWQDARLFSLPHTSSDPHAIWQFELASSQAIISWRYLEKPGFLNLATTISYEEYNRLIDSLNSYIAMWTKLPLYDLRR